MILYDIIYRYYIVPTDINSQQDVYIVLYAVTGCMHLCDLPSGLTRNFIWKGVL